MDTGSECDFILKSGIKATEAWQVSLEINSGNEKREIRGLLQAMKELGLKEGGVFTYTQEGERKVKEGLIRLIPVWMWLLMD